jgi:hypothetical protein
MSLVSSQFGLEDTPGTEVDADHKWNTLTYDAQIEMSQTEYTQAGTLVPVAVVTGKLWDSFTVKGAVDYNELCYLLNSLLMKVAGVQQGSTAAYLYTYAPSPFASETLESWTTQWGDASGTANFKALQSQMADLSLKFDRDKVELDGKGLARFESTGVTMTEDPAIIPRMPVTAPTVSVYLASTMAGLASATAISRGFEAEIGIAGRVEPVWELNAATPSYADLAPGTLKTTGKLSISTARAEAATLLASMPVNSQQFMRIKAVGPLIASTFYHTLTIDAPVLVSKAPKKGGKSAIYSYDWEFLLNLDVTTSKFLNIALINTIATM